jgi:hypothetical protein
MAEPAGTGTVGAASTEQMTGRYDMKPDVNGDKHTRESGTQYDAEQLPDIGSQGRYLNENADEDHISEAMRIHAIHLKAISQ